MTTNMAGKLRSMSFEVFGKVQGVWFRKYTKRTAQKYGLVGWVMNTKRNTVVGCIQGEEEPIKEMKTWLSSEGSPRSRIDKCEFKDERTLDKIQFITFDVRK